MQYLFTAMQHSYLTPVALTVIAWGVIVGVLSRYYTVPQIWVRLGHVMLVAAIITLALAAWLAWLALNT